MKLFNLQKSVTVIVLIFTGYTSFAQITKQWESRYTETGYSDDSADDIIIDGNGNTFVLGHTGSDALLLKYDIEGKIVWSFQAGRGVFMEDPYEPARDFKMDAAGNLYLLLRGYDGHAFQTAGVYLLKVDASGKLVWKQRVDGNSKGRIKLAVHSDGSAFVFRPTNYSQLSLTKITSSGTLAWTKVFDASEEQFAQQVSIINDTIVVWHYAGYQTYHRKSYLHLYTLNGDLVWENEYKYETWGTSITSLQYHSGELFVSYFIDNSSDSFHQIWRYDMSTGTVVKNFRVQMDNTFYGDEPLAGMFVGDDSFIYVMGEDDVILKKYSPDGELQWSSRYVNNFNDYEAADIVFNKATSVMDVLFKIRNFNTAAISYTIVSLLPDKTNKVLANITASKPDITLLALVESETNLFVAGSFTKNDDFGNDVLVSNFTKLNSRVWETTFSPVNSLQHLPTCMAGDAQGNTYVGGMLSAPNQNSFGIIKYDPDGKQVWATKFAPDNQYGYGLNKTMITAIAVSPEGEIFVTGGIKIANQLNSTSDPVEMYTIKLDTQGNIVWTSKTSGETGDYVTGFQIEIDEDKNIYTLGANHNNNNYKPEQMVLVKHDPNGNLKWEKRFSLVQYTQMATTAQDTDLPKMKIFDQHIYVFNSSWFTEDDWNYSPAMELRKFDTEGNETMLNQTVCQNCDNGAHYFPQDFILDGGGNIYYLYSGFGYGPVGFETVLRAISPSGEALWSRTIEYTDHLTHFSDGVIVLGQSNELYIMTASPAEFSYSRISSDGNEVWNKKEPLQGFDSNFGRPSFAFVKTDGTPVFLSTNKNSENSAYYFLTERDKDTGDIKNTQAFDDVFDTFGDIPYWSPGDFLFAVFKPVNTDDFFITGLVEDKARGAETIVTLKYAFGNGGDNGDDEGEDDDDDDDGGDDDVTAVEKDKGQQILAYPTFTKGIFRIDGLTEETESINLVDSFGRLVRSLNPKNEYFDITDVTAGMYLVKVINRGKLYSAKVVKE